MMSPNLRKNLVSIVPDEQGQIKQTAEKEVMQVCVQKPAGGEIKYPAEGIRKDISCGRVAATGDSESNAYQAPETPSRKGNSINTLMGILKGSQSTPRRKRKYIRKNITVDKLQMKIPQLMDQNHQKKSDDIEANKS